MREFYDISIRRGTVLDPQTGAMEQRDVFVREGRIASAPAPGAVELDAAGCYVSPGFVDVHGHFYPDGHLIGIHADTVCPCSGVTAAIDQGSAGIYNFEDFALNVASRTATALYASLSITNTGVQMEPQEEIQDPVYCDPDKILRVFRRHPRRLVGLKVRVHAQATGPYRLEALRQAQRVARRLREEGFPCRITIHFAGLAEDVTLEEVLDGLEPGDVFSHMYHETGTRIFGEDGAVLPCAARARERGVVFDACDGLGHFSLRNLLLGVRGGFWPDTISTDVVRQTAWIQPGFSLANKLAVYLSAGMPLMDVVRAVTSTPARVYGLEGQGTLEEGAPANLAVFRLENRPGRWTDLFGGELERTTAVVPMATVGGGTIVFQNPLF